MELWAPVRGWEDRYKISSYGRLLCLNAYHKAPKISLGSLSRYGYRVTILKRPGKKQRVRIHRLVLDAFSCMDGRGLECDHVDSNRENNNIGNLQWVSHAENNRRRDQKGHQKKGEQIHTAKLTAADVGMIRSLHRAGKKTREIHHLYPCLSRSKLLDVIKYRTWRHLP